VQRITETHPGEEIFAHALKSSHRSPSCVDERWNQRFAMITRGFVAEFSLALTRNAQSMYLTLATFYSLRQQRAFPTLKHIEAVCPLGGPARSRALAQLKQLGLVEVWAERRGRRRHTFYRLLHVDATGHHLAERQQPTGKELQERQRQGVLGEDYEWLKRAYPKRLHRLPSSWS
jgi:hypothetical protein